MNGALFKAFTVCCTLGAKPAEGRYNLNDLGYEPLIATIRVQYVPPSYYATRSDANAFPGT